MGVTERSVPNTCRVTGSIPVLTAKIKDSEAVIDDGVKMMKKGLE